MKATCEKLKGPAKCHGTKQCAMLKRVHEESNSDNLSARAAKRFQGITGAMAFDAKRKLVFVLVYRTGAGANYVMTYCPWCGGKVSDGAR